MICLFNSPSQLYIFCKKIVSKIESAEKYQYRVTSFTSIYKSFFSCKTVKALIYYFRISFYRRCILCQNIIFTMTFNMVKTYSILLLSSLLFRLLFEKLYSCFNGPIGWKFDFQFIHLTSKQKGNKILLKICRWQQMTFYTSDKDFKIGRVYWVKYELTFI